MKFNSKDGKKLRDTLDAVLARYGFALREGSGVPHIVEWEKNLGETISAEVSVSVNPAIAPDIWSIEPMVMVNSTYVAMKYQELGLHHVFGKRNEALHQRPPRELQVLRFLPAHIRWQENLHLQYPTLKGRPDTLGLLKEEFADVMEHYVAPVLDRFTDPFAVAQFQLRAATEFRSTRLPREQPRYRVSNQYISTALLFDQAGCRDRALALLEDVRQQRAQLLQANSEIYVERLLWQIDTVLRYLRNDAPSAQ